MRNLKLFFVLLIFLANFLAALGNFAGSETEISDSGPSCTVEHFMKMRIIVNLLVVPVFALLVGFSAYGSSAFVVSSTQFPSQGLSVGLWPLPATVKEGTEDPIFVDAASFRFQLTPESELTPTLSTVMDRYVRLIFIHGTNTSVPLEWQRTSSVLSSCTLRVASANTTVWVGMDESYTLTVSATNGCHIEAVTFVGAMYGMETLSQLVLSDAGALTNSQVTYFIPNSPWEIQDAPRFQWRGLMVDTARHFLPVNALLRQLDGMAFSKMNVFHWHLSDAQSFPFASEVHPNITVGAFSARAVYLPTDIAAVVEYARLRGINVVVETDMPGHSYAMTMA